MPLPSCSVKILVALRSAATIAHPVYQRKSIFSKAMSERI